METITEFTDLVETTRRPEVERFTAPGLLCGDKDLHKFFERKKKTYAL